jgi:hypothetical protein
MSKIFYGLTKSRTFQQVVRPTNEADSTWHQSLSGSAFNLSKANKAAAEGGGTRTDCWSITAAIQQSYGTENS